MTDPLQVARTMWADDPKWSFVRFDAAGKVVLDYDGSYP